MTREKERGPYHNIHLLVLQARKAFRRMKGIIRFQKLTQFQSVKKQSTNTLNHLHSWSMIQTQIRHRRQCMVTDGRLKQKKLENQMKLEAKLHDLEVCFELFYLFRINT